jgi:hypothetical protein
MTRRQRTIAISVSATGAALALAIGLIVALTGSSAPTPAASPSTARLLSPFTGEPVAALDVRPRPGLGSPRITTQTSNPRINP